MNKKKQIKRKLIQLQNKFGKELGKVAWQNWKLENEQSKTGINNKTPH